MYEKYSVFALNQIGRFKPLFEEKGHYIVGVFIELISDTLNIK